MRQRGIIFIAAGLALLFILALLWLLGGAGRSGRTGFLGLGGRSQMETASNLPLDVRFEYDALLLSPGEFDDRAEFPLILEGQGWRLCGKRLRGVGKWLAREPAPMLYDFVGSSHDEMFTQFYGLQLQGSQSYEDARIQGRLALHQTMTYLQGPQTEGWPAFAPESSAASGRLCVEGWSLFTEDDLFFFYAFSGEPLTGSQREACMQVLESMEFRAVLGGEDWVRDPYEAVKDQLPEAEREKLEGEAGTEAVDGSAGESGGAVEGT